MAKIALVKTEGNIFKLAYDSDIEEAKKIKIGDVYVYEFKKPRNYQFHKKLFALFNLVYQNQDKYNNIDDLRRDLIVCSGYYTKRVDMFGLEVYEPLSLSFASMDEHVFEDLYNSIVDTICREFNFGKQDIIDNVAQYF